MSGAHCIGMRRKVSFWFLFSFAFLIVINPQDKRWIVVIFYNEADWLCVLRLTTENRTNTTKLKGDNKGNGKAIYFKHFVEIKDADGKPIKIGGVRFIENDSKYDLNNRQVAKVRDTVLNHSRQATENKKKIAVLKNGDKKKKQD